MTNKYSDPIPSPKTVGSWNWPHLPIQCRG